ncbi:MAG: hypothetical protein ING75_15215 [Rhodocyclaceae bacterium]|nr:hypothetical protein [Rhodocyclaceae bacterium]
MPDLPAPIGIDPTVPEGMIFSAEYSAHRQSAFGERRLFMKQFHARGINSSLQLAVGSL